MKTGAGSPVPVGTADPRVRVRMYRLGLGDCFLLTFYGGERPAHVLIDCGTLGCTKGVKVSDVIGDIAQATDRHLDLVVATHEHLDHVSGFITCIDQFREIQVDHVWVAWTEDASDPDARELEKYKGDLLRAVSLAATSLRGAAAAGGRDGSRELSQGVDALLQLHGVGGENVGLATRTNEAMNNVTKLSGKADFLSPGKVLEPKWAGGARFYVLGPPRDKKAIKDMGDYGSPDLYGIEKTSLANAASAARFFAAALDETDASEGCPFDPALCIPAADRSARRTVARAYDHADDAWRRIDNDWLVTAADYSLQLDTYTNNTSLALAIEVGDRVLLFPGDAQEGNWLSWHAQQWHVGDANGGRTITAEDLLKRTVFYKVGHHSSHNATLKGKGLELMGSDELVAFIPLDGAVAQQKKWPMPAADLYTRLLDKTGGRVIRSDTGWPASASASGAVDIQDLYVDYILR